MNQEIPTRFEDEDAELGQLISLWCSLSEAQRKAYQRTYGGINAETVVQCEPKIGRNDPCPCGSGKKYKKCCLVNGVER